MRGCWAFPLHSVPLRQNPVRGPCGNVDFGISLSCVGPKPPTLLRSDHYQKRGEIMELLELEPPHYGVYISGIYVIDDDGTATLAGPFASEAAAIRWIDQLRDTLTSCRPSGEAERRASKDLHSSCGSVWQPEKRLAVGPLIR